MATTYTQIYSLTGLKPSMAMSDLVREIKTGSTNHINENRWGCGTVFMAGGIRCVHCAHSQLADVILYFAHQAEHHKRRAFQEARREFLTRFNVSFDDRYLFQSIERTTPPHWGVFRGAHYFASSAASMAVVISVESGVTLDSKRLRILPSLPMRNLLKFHLMSPGNGESLPARSV